MIGLIMATIFTSAMDSLNPVAITQQFILQGMVKKPKHIWFFILATAVTNFIGGLMVYLGLVSVVSEVIESIFVKYGEKIYIIEFILGIIILMFTLYTILNRRIKLIKEKYEVQSQKECEEKKLMNIKSVSPLSLMLLGVIATIAELTTAVPYFAFLAILLNHELNIIFLIFILIIYNFVYSLPLMTLYFIYMKKQEIFESFYLFIKSKMTKWSVITVPLVLGIVGFIIIYHSLNSLLL